MSQVEITKIQVFAIRKEFSIPTSLYLSSVLTAMKVQRKDGSISPQQLMLREDEKETILSYVVNSMRRMATLSSF